MPTTPAWAALLVTWHRTIGLRLADERMRNSSDSLVCYKNAVEAISEWDMRERARQQELVRMQLSGVFEWFYSERIPESLAREYGADYAGRELHEIARHGLQVPERHDEPKKEPDGWLDIETRHALLDGARRQLIGSLGEHPMLDGVVNVLVSCSLERNQEGTPQLLSLDSLGLRIIGQEQKRENDIIDLLGADGIRVLRAIAD